MKHHIVVGLVLTTLILLFQNCTPNGLTAESLSSSSSSPEDAEPSLSEVSEEGDEELGISGIISHGNVISIKTNGTYDFGVKNQQAPLIWDDFSTGADGQLLSEYNPQWKPYQKSGALISGLYPRYSGAKAAYNDTSRHGFSTNYWTVAPSKKRFVSYWFRTVDADVTDYSVIKLIRVTSSIAAGGGGVYNGIGSFAVSNMNPRYNSEPYVLFTNSSDVGSSLGPSGENKYMSAPFNEWTKVEMRIDLSDMDVSNGRFWVTSRSQNRTVWEQGRDNLVMRTGGTNYLIDTTLLGVMHANSEGTFGLMNTGVYTDNSWSRIAVGSTSDFKTCRDVEEQPYLSWSKKQIKVKINIAAFPVNSPLYLWFINEENIPSVPIKIR